MDHIDDQVRDDDEHSFSIASITEVQEQNLVTDELAHFREQWKSEVAEKQNLVKPGKEKQGCSPNSPDQSRIDEARRLFLQGIENEKNRNMHCAIKSYRMAVQLDPEIEQRMSETMHFDQPSSDEEQTDVDTSVSLVEKFSLLCLAHPNKHSHNTIITSLNILELPSEILSCIFRWVASSHMDMKSIEAISETCRKFYLHARDEALWRSACEKIWGVHDKHKDYLSWRNMFIERPHVRFDGVYISKVSYFRQGDPTVFSANYQPFQCVEYFRYIRFFENGKMILYTTPDEPARAIPKLKLEMAKQYHFRVGHFKAHSEQQKKFKTLCITAILLDMREDKPTYRSYKRATRGEKKYILTESEYVLELELTSTSTKKRCNKLSWLNYSCTYKFGDDDRIFKDDIKLHDQYPPFYHSGVKSFVRYAEAILL